MSRRDRSQQIAAWMCGVGVILVLVGYRGMTRLPLTPEEYERQRGVDEFRAGRGRRIEHGPPGMQRLLKKSRGAASPGKGRVPPYLTEGRLAFGAGLLLGLAGVVLWYRGGTDG